MLRPLLHKVVWLDNGSQDRRIRLYGSSGYGDTAGHCKCPALFITQPNSFEVDHPHHFKYDYNSGIPVKYSIMQAMWPVGHCTLLYSKGSFVNLGHPVAPPLWIHPFLLGLWTGAWSHLPLASICPFCQNAEKPDEVDFYPYLNQWNCGNISIQCH